MKPVKKKIETVRMGDKIFVMNGVDTLSYIDLTNIHRKWWQVWKRKVRTYPKTRYAIYYKFKKQPPKTLLEESEEV